MCNSLKPFLFGVLSTLAALGFLTVIPANAAPTRLQPQNPPSATMTFNARPGKNKLVSLNDDGSIVAVNAKFVDKVESFKTGDDRSEVHVYFISDVTGESTELCTTTVSPKEADKFIADVNAAKN